MKRLSTMRPQSHTNTEAAAPDSVANSSLKAMPRSEWGTLTRLFPYLWAYKWRVMAALAFMVGAKVANVGVPLLLKQLVDAMNPNLTMGTQALLVVPVALLLGYGLLRLSTSLLNCVNWCFPKPPRARRAAFH
jgi:ATP-binding cassette, subfamily B, heavy metal transporter